MTKNRIKCPKCKLNSYYKLHKNSLGDFVVLDRCRHKFTYKKKKKTLINGLNYTLEDSIGKRIQT